MRQDMIRHRAKSIRRGFTLIEMTISIAVIVMVASLALPSIISIFGAGSESQAYNLLSAQLTAARALAIQNANYAGVHVQLAADDSGEEGRCFVAIMVYDPVSRTFSLDHVSEAGTVSSSGDETLTESGKTWSADQWKGYSVRIRLGTGAGQIRSIRENTSEQLTIEPAWGTHPGAGAKYVIFQPSGHSPQRVPGSIAFGEIRDPFVDGSGAYDNDNLSDSDLPDFTTFTIVFSPSGSVVRWIRGAPIEFDTTIGLFTTYEDSRRIWDPSNVNGHAGASAVTIFDYPQLAERSEDDRADYLNECGQFLPVNIHTGQVMVKRGQ